MSPARLNARTIGLSKIIRPSELDGSFEDIFVDKKKRLPGGVAAISPLRHEPRVLSQRGCFTIHENLDTPLEELYPECVSRVTIPADLKPEAKRFLALAGITEFTVFPDLDGLARELKAWYLT